MPDDTQRGDTEAPAGPAAGTDRGRCARVLRSRRAAVCAAAAAVVGAFLLWGPVGLGSGPLAVQMGLLQGNQASSLAPEGFIIPLYNSGHDAVVVDAVKLVGGTRYPVPRQIGLDVLTTSLCGGAWPARGAGKSFAMVGCGGPSRGALIGRPIGHTAPVSGGFAAAAEVRAPPAGTCWVMTQVIVHYHVGIRHYTASDPFELALCVRAAPAVMNAAMNAAGGG
jgi:hypothetical protein